jgi:transglutaminase-like putative cysteine protease
MAAPTRAFRPRLLMAGVLITLLCAVVLQSMDLIFHVGAWQWQILLIFAVTVLPATVVASVLPPRRETLALVSGASAGAVTWFVLLIGTGRAGEWLRHPVDMFDQAAQVVNTAATPFDPAGPVGDLLLLMGLMLGIAASSLLVGVGAPFATGGFLSLLLLAPVAATGVVVDRSLIIAAGVLLVLLAWTAAPRISVPGLTMAALAGVIAVGVVAAMPDATDRVWNPAVVKSPVNSTVPDVTVSLAEDLKKRSGSRVFSFETATPGAHYFTLATLADFEDGRWTPKEDAREDGAVSLDEPRSAQTPPGLQSTTVTMDGLRSEWLPLPQSAYRVVPTEERPEDRSDFEPDKWTWMTDSATAKASKAVTRDGDLYTVESVPLVSSRLGEVDLGALAASGVDTGTIDQASYLELPGEMPTSLRDAANEAAGGVTDRIQAGYALENWFRTSGFSYDDSVPYDPGAEGPYSVMESLLTQRSGFCVHYASTFTVMARELGIPARMAVGYAARTNAEGPTNVKARELHAWPEILVDGIGWVAFEPTPGGPGGLEVSAEGQPAEETPAEETPEPPEPSEEPPAESETPSETPEPPEPSEPSEPSTIPQPEEMPEDPASPEVDEEDSGFTIPLPVLVAVGVVLLLLAPALVRWLVGRWRRRGITSGGHPAQDAWSEATAKATDLGLSPASGDLRARTPEAWAEQLGGDQVQALASAASAERFGGRDYSDSREDLRGLLDGAVEDLSGRGSRVTRVLAVLVPRSLFRRRGL